jgi:hypothetical protein
MAEPTTNQTKPEALGFKLVKKGDEFAAKYDGGAVVPIEKDDGLLFDLARMVDQLQQDKIKGDMCAACVNGCSKGKNYPECGQYNSRVSFQSPGHSPISAPALATVNTSAAINPDYPGQNMIDKIKKMDEKKEKDKWICEKCGGPKSTAVCPRCDSTGTKQEPVKKEKPKRKPVKKEEPKQEAVNKAPVVPVNASFLFMRRSCSNLDEKLDCKIKPDKGFCPHDESNEKECPTFVEKKRDDVKIKIVDPNYYLVMKNGIEEHVHKKFNCTVCNELKPVKPADKCPKCPFLPEDITKFKCEHGVCSKDESGQVTIHVQHEAGYPFCLNACPKYKAKGGSKQNIPEKKNTAPKPPAMAKKPKKEQPKLF